MKPGEGGADPTAVLPAGIDDVPGQSHDLVTDDIIARHLGAEEGGVRPRKPAVSDDEPDDVDDEIIPGDEDLDDDAQDHSDDDDAGDDELEEDGLEDDELDEDEEDNPDELEDRGDHDDEDDTDLEVEGKGVASKLTPEELEEVRADPRLSKRLKQLERGFTEKTEELAVKARNVSLREADVDEFIQELQTVDGAVSFLKDQVLRNPELVGAAFEAVATDDATAVGFLVEVGLVKPEALEAAMARLEELRGDEREMKIHERERGVSAKERKLELEAKRTRDRRLRQRHIEIRTDMQKFAKREGIDEEDLPKLRQAIAAKITQNRERDPQADINRDELRQVVGQFAKDRKAEIDRLLRKKGIKPPKDPKAPTSKVRKGEERPAVRSRTRVPPGGGGLRRRGARKGADKGPPEGVDPLDWALNRAANKHLAQ